MYIVHLKLLPGSSFVSRWAGYRCCQSCWIGQSPGWSACANSSCARQRTSTLSRHLPRKVDHLPRRHRICFWRRKQLYCRIHTSAPSPRTHRIVHQGHPSGLDNIIPEHQWLLHPRVSTWNLCLAGQGINWRWERNGQEFGSQNWPGTNSGVWRLVSKKIHSFIQVLFCN